MDKEYRILVILQIFTIILVFKGISATYLATQYAMQEQLWIIEKYAFLTKFVPVLLLIPLILYALPLIFKIKNKSQKILNRIALVLFIIGLASLAIF